VRASLTLPISRALVRQSGAVLIMALLIVALVAGLSIKFAGDFQLGLARAESRWHGVQARAYLLGMESAALQLLEEADQNPEVDYLGEGWDTEVPFEIDGGWILARAVDATSQLNLNSLGGAPFAADKPANSPERYTEPQRRFIRLLQTFPDLPVSEQQAIEILEAIVDWMDPDEEQSGFGGAESYYYQGLEPPYNAANGPFRSVDELRLVRYMTPELMMLLRPYITVLPGEGGGMNINTLSPQLLRTLNGKNELQPLDEMAAQRLAEQLPIEGYASVNDFSSAWGTAGGAAGELVADGLAVKTEYFWLYIQVDMVEQRRGMQVLLKRNPTKKFDVLLRNDTY